MWTLIGRLGVLRGDTSRAFAAGPLSGGFWQHGRGEVGATRSSLYSGNPSGGWWPNSGFIKGVNTKELLSLGGEGWRQSPSVFSPGFFFPHARGCWGRAVCCWPAANNPPPPNSVCLWSHSVQRTSCVQTFAQSLSAHFYTSGRREGWVCSLWCLCTLTQALFSFFSPSFLLCRNIRTLFSFPIKTEMFHFLF